jgi:SAM-dependent methyltransferase
MFKDRRNDPMTDDSIMQMPQPPAEALFDLVEGSMDGLRRTYLFLTASDIGLFDRLSAPRSPEDLAREEGLDLDMTRLFCEALCAMSLLRKEGDEYVNGETAMTYLCRSSPYYQERSFDRMRRSLGHWQTLERTLHDGPERIEPSQMFGERWMEAIAQHSRCGDVQKVVSKVSGAVDLSGNMRLLDLGGGHGLYAIAFTSVHPGLRAVVFDLPTIAPVTRQYIARYQADRVEVMEGDFNVDPIGGSYDMVFSSFNSSGSDVELIPKIRNSLKEGGVFVVRQHSAWARDDPILNFEWNFVSHDGKGGRKRFSGPRSVRLDEYATALRDHGFRVLDKWSMDRTSDILIARKDR